MTSALPIPDGYGPWLRELKSRIDSQAKKLMERSTKTIKLESQVVELQTISSSADDHNKVLKENVFDLQKQEPLWPMGKRRTHEGCREFWG